MADPVNAKKREKLLMYVPYTYTQARSPGGRRERTTSGGDRAVSSRSSLPRLGEAEWGGVRPRKNGGGNFLEAKERAEVKAKVNVGDNEIPFNKEATRWLGVWLDSQLTLKEHHATRLKNRRNALTRLRRLAGQLGLSPANCRKVMTASIQSVAMFGAELWWKGEGVRGTVGRTDDLQLLVNQQARATTGAFRTTNLGALPTESGLRPVTNQLENRQRRFALRLLSLPRGEKARNVVGANTAIGKRLAKALNYTWTETEETVLLEEREPSMRN